MKKLVFTDQLESYSIGEFIDQVDFDSMRRKLEDIEKRFAAKRYTKFYFDWNYDEYCSTVTVHASREESDAELENRIKLEEQHRLEAIEAKKAIVTRQEEEEKKLFLKLKKKYESS